MELRQVSTDISVLRARWAGDRYSRFLAQGLARSLSSTRVRFLWVIQFHPHPSVAHHTQSLLPRGRPSIASSKVTFTHLPNMPLSSVAPLLPSVSLSLFILSLSLPIFHNHLRSYLLTCKCKCTNVNVNVNVNEKENENENENQNVNVNVNVRCQMYNVEVQVRCTGRCTMSDVQCQMSDVRCTMSDVRCQM